MSLVATLVVPSSEIESAVLDVDGGWSSHNHSTAFVHLVAVPPDIVTVFFSFKAVTGKDFTGFVDDAVGIASTKPKLGFAGTTSTPVLSAREKVAFSRQHDVLAFGILKQGKRPNERTKVLSREISYCNQCVVCEDGGTDR